MANNVTFNIRLKVDGKERVVQLSGDVQSLVRSLRDTDGASGQVQGALRKVGEAMGVARSDAESLNMSLVNLNQVSEIFGTLSSTVKEVQGVMSELTEGYAVQARAEVQLQTVMKQRMGATDDEIASIKALASAQQELGVIGDEVQLMGAQQLATFLGEKGSIEALLPAMNDLLAQQKGLNATTGDAVGIGTLLGKAMQGQTSVLTRVGIVFSDAQEQVMKYGTESQRASMLAQVITDNVSHMNSELAKTDIGRQQQLENKLGDIKEQLGQLVQPAMRAMTALATTTQAVSGIARLGTSLKGLHTMMLTATASSTALKWSIRGLEVATGIGALLAALSIGVEVFGRRAEQASGAAGELSDGIDGLQASMAREESQVNATRAALEMNIARLQEFKGTKAEEKALVDELNTTYGDTMGYFDSVAKWYEALTANSEAYCRQLVIEARMRALANQVAEKETEMAAKRQERRDKVGSGELSTTRPRVAEMDVDVFGNRVVTGWKEGASEAEQYISRIDEELVDGALQINRMKEEMRDLASEASKLSIPLQGSSIRPGSEGGTKGGVVSTTGGISGLSQMSGAGLQSVDVEVRASNLDQVTGQFAALGETLQGPIDAIDRLNAAMGDGSSVEDYAGALANVHLYMEQLGESQAGALVSALQGNMEQAAKAADKQAKKVQFAKESVVQFGGALSGLGDALELPALNVAGTIAQAIANVALSYASATAQASEMGPWAWIAFAAAGLAEMTAVIASIKQATAFADGGVVSGPTYALIGEYAGASNNPEVVAPLSRLRDLIEPAGVGLPERIELVADGRELRALLLREGNRYRRE